MHSSTFNLLISPRHHLSCTSLAPPLHLACTSTCYILLSTLLSHPSALPLWQGTGVLYLWATLVMRLCFGSFTTAILVGAFNKVGAATLPSSPPTSTPSLACMHEPLSPLPRWSPQSRLRSTPLPSLLPRNHSASCSGKRALSPSPPSLLPTSYPPPTHPHPSFPLIPYPPSLCLSPLGM